MKENTDKVNLELAEIVKRVENMYKPKTYSYNNSTNVNSDMYIHYTVTKILNFCVLEIKFSRGASANILIPAEDMPVEFRPAYDVLLSGTAHHGVSMDYSWIKLTPQGKFFTHNEASGVVRNLQTTVSYITNI